MEQSGRPLMGVESARRHARCEARFDSMTLALLLNALISSAFVLITALLVSDGLPLDISVRTVLSLEVVTCWIGVRTMLAFVPPNVQDVLSRVGWWCFGALLGWPGLFLCLVAGGIGAFRVFNEFVWMTAAGIVVLTIAVVYVRNRPGGGDRTLASFHAVQVALAVLFLVTVAAIVILVPVVVLVLGSHGQAAFGPSLAVATLVVYWMAGAGHLRRLRDPSPGLARVVGAGFHVALCVAIAAMTAMFQPVASVRPFAAFLAQSVYPFALVYAPVLLLFVVVVRGFLRPVAPALVMLAVLLLGLTPQHAFEQFDLPRRALSAAEHPMQRLSPAHRANGAVRAAEKSGIDHRFDDLIEAYWGGGEITHADRESIEGRLAGLLVDDEARAPLLSRLARCRWQHGRRDEAIELLQQAAPLAARRSPWEMVLVESLRARWLVEAGRAEEAERLATSLARELPAGGGAVALWAVADLVEAFTLTGALWRAEELTAGFAHFESHTSEACRRGTAKLRLARSRMLLTWGRMSEAEAALRPATWRARGYSDRWLEGRHRALMAQQQLLKSHAREGSERFADVISDLEGASEELTTELATVLRVRAVASAMSSTAGAALQDALWAADLVSDGTCSDEERGRTLVVLGAILAAEDRVAEAEDAFEQAMAAADRVTRPRWGLSLAWHNAARIAVRRGRVSHASRLFAAGHQRAMRELETALPLLCEAQRLSAVESVALRFQQQLLHLARHGSSEQVAQAFLAWSQLRGVVARAQVLERRWAQDQDAREAKDLLALLTAATTRLTRHWLLNRQSAELTTKVAGLERDLARLAYEGGVRVLDERCGLGDAVSGAPSHSLYLDFVRAPREDGDAEYLAFAVRGGGRYQPRLVRLGRETEIAPLVARMYVSMAFGTAKSDARAAGRAVYRKILGPFEEIVAECDEIMILPDGVLSLVPFSALPFRDGYLVDQATTSIVTGLTAWDETAAQRRPGNAVVLADPELQARVVASNGLTGETGRSRFGTVALEPLPGARREGRLLTEMLNNYGVRVRYGVGPEATEQKLREAVSPDAVHIAAHGFFLPKPEGREPHDLVDVAHASIGVLPRSATDDPMARSGMFLAGAADSVSRRNHDRGVLTARKVLQLQLADTSVVVLSGCLTGLGDYQTGEGLLGLTRAFLIAGTDSVIVTLWPVDDHTTQQLMFEFYHEWLNSRSPREALRLAQRHLRRDGLHPSYWAPFVLARNSGN